MSIWRGGKNRKSFKKSDISKPTQFEHRIHADFDPITGDIRGLPVVFFICFLKIINLPNLPNEFLFNSLFSYNDFTPKIVRKMNVIF